MRTYRGRFQDIRRNMEIDLVEEADRVDNGEWQAIRGDHHMSKTYELSNVVLQVAVPALVDLLQDEVKPNLPWAEDHFLERVGGLPLNPPPSHEWWPHGTAMNAEHMDGGKFSHTYPERFWPKFANEGQRRPNGRDVFVPHNGIRYEYGELVDVVALLINSPGTRQAYLPVWFPEDTGNVSRVRVPCTLGYQFMLRQGELQCTYFIRSCDFVRHFVDDVYMAARLMQWMVERLNYAGLTEVKTGVLTMHAVSMHIFPHDLKNLRGET